MGVASTLTLPSAVAPGVRCGGGAVVGEAVVASRSWSEGTRSSVGRVGVGGVGGIGGVGGGVGETGGLAEGVVQSGRVDARGLGDGGSARGVGG